MDICLYKVRLSSPVRVSVLQAPLQHSLTDGYITSFQRASSRDRPWQSQRFSWTAKIDYKSCFFHYLLSFPLTVKVISILLFSVSLSVVFNASCLPCLLPHPPGARLREQSEVQRRQVHHRAGPHDQGQWLGLRDEQWGHDHIRGERGGGLDGPTNGWLRGWEGGSCVVGECVTLVWLIYH